MRWPAWGRSAAADLHLLRGSWPGASDCARSRGWRRSRSTNGRGARLRAILELPRPAGHSIRTTSAACQLKLSVGSFWQDRAFSRPSLRWRVMRNPCAFEEQQGKDQGECYVWAVACSRPSAIRLTRGQGGHDGQMVGLGRVLHSEEESNQQYRKRRQRAASAPM